MGLLDSVVGALGQAAGGGGGGGQQQALMNAVLALLADQGGGGGAGGLGGLVAKLQQAGLGDVVNWWISTGQNMPVSADVLQGALGSDTLGPLARQLGLGEGALAGGLAGLLPQVVDGLTPNGQLPADGSATPDLGALIGSLLAR